VGQYRESLSYICGELQSEILKLFIPCPNQQLAKETIGVGEPRKVDFKSFSKNQR